jgi:hypothetical protein
MEQDLLSPQTLRLRVFSRPGEAFMLEIGRLIVHKPGVIFAVTVVTSAGGF